MTENYGKRMKETEEDPKKWKKIPCSWIRRTNIVKMPILSQAIYIFNAAYLPLSQTINLILEYSQHFFCKYTKFHTLYIMGEPVMLCQWHASDNPV